MFGISSNQEAGSKLAALDGAQAIVEFAPDGVVLSANRNFLNLMGYTLAEARGGHHSMSIVPAERNSDAYKTFWAALRGAVRAVA